MSKFLVIWSLDVAVLGQAAVRAIFAMPAYAEKLFAEKKLDKRYHIVGAHGGAWIYSVESNEELDRLLAMSPVYNLAKYTVYALAEMTDKQTVVSEKA
jgi:muconolactone delta-isomerase